MKKLHEDAPVNNVGGGGIAGVGVGPAGEPGVPVAAQKKRYGKTKSIPTPVIISMLRRKAPQMAEEQINEITRMPRDKGSLKRDEPITIMKRNDPLEQRKGKESARNQYQREFTPYYARRKIAKGNLTPKDEIKASLGKHHKPGHLPEETFAGAVVFEVSSSTFHNAKTEKRKGKHWKTYLDECDELAEIREYAKKNPNKAIVLRNENTGEMCYARYGRKG